MKIVLFLLTLIFFKSVAFADCRTTEKGTICTDQRMKNISMSANDMKNAGTACFSPSHQYHFRQNNAPMLFYTCVVNDYLIKYGFPNSPNPYPLDGTYKENLYMQRLDNEVFGETLPIYYNSQSNKVKIFANVDLKYLKAEGHLSKTPPYIGDPVVIEPNDFCAPAGSEFMKIMIVNSSGEVLHKKSINCNYNKRYYVTKTVENLSFEVDASKAVGIKVQVAYTMQGQINGSSYIDTWGAPAAQINGIFLQVQDN
nr:hypothetical protein GTC16762_33590 [Pigmentibacter ruber]